MFFKVSLVVLSVVSLAHCAPGYLGGYHALPAATSYSSRIDIHGPEYVKTYAAPVIAKTIIPSYHEPLLGYGGYGYGHGLEHGYGYGQGIGFGQGLGYGHGLEHGLGHGIGHYY